ncbi:PREDICTED: uncharacterized protein LOC104750401 [Camelina sativa]|uniref:Uncharacterized protein LOC104750401 n=1 Tax=Camelina sativa TaxID=90675 RepID=A0ABM0WFT9_CAMSA|nr:PREDICTED: uncharacterized protein LOC104750401 [Camelina sativa]
MLPFSNYYISSPSMSERNISNNNGNKRRKKKRPTLTVYDGRGGGEGDDDLAVVKAAAWAWYLRKEGKPIMREFDLTRATRTPRPSRYKIEATKNMILSENKVLAENRFSTKSPLWYTNYSFRGDQETQYSRLLDTYEIKNKSKRLNIDDYSFSVSSSNDLWHNGNDHHHNHNRNDEYGCDDHGLLQKRNGYDNNTATRTKNDKSYNGGFMRKVGKRSLWKGMIVMGPGSTVCGRSDDVASQAGRRTVKVAAAAEALVRSAANGKTQSGRR